MPSILDGFAAPFKSIDAPPPQHNPEEHPGRPLGTVNEESLEEGLDFVLDSSHDDPAAAPLQAPIAGSAPPAREKLIPAESCLMARWSRPTDSPAPHGRVDGHAEGDEPADHI